jgi:hypothetical protein
LPSRALFSQPAVACGVFDHAGVEGVANAALEASEGLLVALALGHLAVVVGAALAVPVPDLGDRGHVDGVVEMAAAASGEPVDLLPARGHVELGRCR